MIVLDMPQGGPEWEMARIGRPTASGFDKILTPSTLKPSKSAVPYRNQILAEWLLGYPIDFAPRTPWMERGTELEPEARAYYEMQHDVEVETVGLVMTDDGKVAGSPDGLVGDDGGLELKCPAIQTHIGYMLDPDKLVSGYRYQVQGYLYLTGRAWWDLVSYFPGLPDVTRRIGRDAEYIAALEAALKVFVKDLDAAKEKLAPHRIIEPEPVAA